MNILWTIAELLYDFVIYDISHALRVENVMVLIPCCGHGYTISGMVTTESHSSARTAISFTARLSSASLNSISHRVTIYIPWPTLDGV